MKRHFINIFVFPVSLPFLPGVIMPSLAAKETKRVLITERNQTEKRILHYQEPLPEKIGT
jgi:hypothetical protein